jgi:hypothetical protein
MLPVGWISAWTGRWGFLGFWGRVALLMWLLIGFAAGGWIPWSVSFVPGFGWRRLRMSAIGKKKGLLEVFKFGTYIAIPIVMMYAFANNSENLEKIIRNVSTSVLLPPTAMAVFGHMYLVRHSWMLSFFPVRALCFGLDCGTDKLWFSGW